MSSETAAKTSRSQDAPIRRAQILGEPAYTVEEIAKGLAVKPKTVREWISRGELMAVRFGKRLFISQTAIKEFKEANEQRQRQVMEAKRQERERQAELDRLWKMEPRMGWSIVNCIGCGQEPVFATRHRRLDGDVFCDSCSTRTPDRGLSKDAWERKVLVEAAERNAIAEEEFGDQVNPPFWFVHHCGYCGAPYALSRAQVKDPHFSPSCLHRPPFGDFEMGGLVAPDVFLEIHKIQARSLAPVEALQRNLEAAQDPLSNPLWSVSRCASCGEAQAVATRDDRLIGQTTCRVCAPNGDSRKPDHWMSVISEALEELDPGQSFKVGVCSPCRCHPELKDASAKGWLLLSWCYELDSTEREKLASDYAERYSLSPKARQELIWDMAEWEYQDLWNEQERERNQDS